MRIIRQRRGKYKCSGTPGFTCRTTDSMRSRIWRGAPLIILFLLISSPARADAGTPLMWAGMLHLLVLNAAIGILESWVSGKLVKSDWRRIGIPITLGNYFSMIAG